MNNAEDNAYIRRLRERLSENPASRLFLSLAEELRKRDMVAEAYSVLIDGIRQSPDYPAARIALGRWFLHDDKFHEAAEQFSEVLKKDPVNKFARKGLADANRELGITSGIQGAGREPSEPVLSRAAEAERFIALGHYESAMKLFEEMLADKPGDKRILQEKEELAALIKFSKRKKGRADGVIKQLNAFLEAIKIHFASRNQVIGNG